MAYRCKLDDTLWQYPPGLYQHWIDSHDGVPGYITPGGSIASARFAQWVLTNAGYDGVGQ